MKMAMKPQRSLTFCSVATAALLLLLADLAGNVESASVPLSPTLDENAVTDWTRGRMTFYGRDGYSIHDGACHYGGVPFPYYVAATSDWWPEYRNGDHEQNRCGTCFELQCDPNGRSYCRNDRVNASVIVRVTDRCPCHHENPSNQQWCCGDMPHFDVSHEAFGELASHTGGWVYLQWREIECPDVVGLGGDLLEDPMTWTPFCDQEDEKTISDVATEQGLTTFLEALWRAGPEVWNVVTTKSHEHSVLAPTNEAFEKAAEEMDMTVEEFLEEPSLNYIMKYHVLKGAVDFEDSACDDVQPGGSSCEEEKEWGKCDDIRYDFKSNGHCRKTCGFCESFNTLADQSLSVSRSSNSSNVVIDKGHGPLDASIVDSLSGCNGKLAVVDSVLYPFCKSADAKGIVEMAQESGLLHFTEAVWKASSIMPDSLGIGNEYGLYTVLAPTDSAFEAAAKEMKFANFSEWLENSAESVVEILKNHIIRGKEHIGYYEKGCEDLPVPSEVIESYPVAEIWNSSESVGCPDLKDLGLCSNEWVADGYCRMSCGRCLKLGDEEEQKQTDRLRTASDRSLYLLQSNSRPGRIFSVGDEPVHIPREAFHASVRLSADEGGSKLTTRAKQGAKVVSPDIDACNGLLNVVDTVLMA